MPSQDAEIDVTVLPRLAPRAADGHKGSYGKVLVIAGSLGMSGAAILAGSAALRGGAGLVQVAVPEPILATVGAAQPCYLTAPLPTDAHGMLSRYAASEVGRLAGSADVVVMGPGLGHSEDIADLLKTFISGHTRPLLLDADALNVLAGHPGVLDLHQCPVVLTPHPGEFGRLSGLEVGAIQQNRRQLAVEFARQHRAVVVLKGAHTVVTDGRRVYVNTTGNPGMATGGTGDVLSGLVGALIGQKLEVFDAAVLGVYLHGLAGDLASKDVGQVSLIASDLLTYLPAAFVKHGQDA